MTVTGMARFSLFALAREALNGHRGWQPHWRDAMPRSSYDVIIIGGGGHGLATAYYLAKEHGISNVAVLEKGLIGSGNVGRNTTIVRSNYLLPGNIPFYELSMKMWEGLEQDFNYNAMVSQRGVLNLYHSDGQRDAYARRGNAMRLHGGFRSRAGCCSPAAGRFGMMPLRGAMPGALRTAGSISSSIARSRVSRSCKDG
jgi:heterotetrameric sarcosine oxidase beta subunit